MDHLAGRAGPHSAASGGITSGIPVLGAVAAGGLVEAFDDVQERLDLVLFLKLVGCSRSP